MISVRWQGMNDPHMHPAHGWDFFDEEDCSFCRRRSGVVETLNYKEYASWYAELGPAIRVWIDGKIVWDLNRGWVINLETI